VELDGGGGWEWPNWVPRGWRMLSAGIEEGNRKWLPDTGISVSLALDALAIDP